jgi:hypothetical protein
MRISSSIAVTATITILVGCTHADEVEVLNNTGTGLDIRACDQVGRLGDGLRTTWYSYCRGPIEIHSAYGQWTYRRFIDSGVVQKAGTLIDGAYYLLRVQIERDGSIAVRGEIPQPIGFPIVPDQRANNAFEPTAVRGGPRLSAARSSWPAAQLGR